MENFSEAVEDFDRAAELNPNYADIYINRGIVYVEMKNYFPNYKNRGLIYFELGDYEKALSDFDKVFEIASFLLEFETHISKYREICRKKLKIAG